MSLDNGVPLDAAFAEACRLLGEALVREEFYKKALVQAQTPPEPDDPSDPSA